MERKYYFFILMELIFAILNYNFKQPAHINTYWKLELNNSAMLKNKPQIINNILVTAFLYTKIERTKFKVSYFIN